MTVSPCVALLEKPAPHSLIQSWSQQLSRYEQQRLDRYKHPHRIAQFITSRRLLKQLIYQQTGIEHCEILHQPSGAPHIETPALYCSLSHSGDNILAGFSQHPIGVDIEQHRPRRQLNQLVDHYFHPNEQTSFHQLTEAKQQQYFFRLWTCKEALAKQHGEGIKLSKLGNAVENESAPLLVVQQADYSFAIACAEKPTLLQAVLDDDGEFRFSTPSFSQTDPAE